MIDSILHRRRTSTSKIRSIKFQVLSLSRAEVDWAYIARSLTQLTHAIEATDINGLAKWHLDLVIKETAHSLNERHATGGSSDDWEYQRWLHQIDV